MKKLLKILKNKRGVTLMELIIGMVISVIITTYVSAVLAPMMNVFYRSNDLAEVNTLLDNVSELMINDFSRATGINIGATNVTISTSVGNVIYSNLGGGAGSVLQRRSPDSSTPADVFAENYYKRKTLIVTINPASGDITGSFTLTLSVNDRNDNPLASREYAVNPIFLQYESLNNN